MLGHGVDTGDISCLTGETDGGFRGCLGWLGGELLGNLLGGGATVAGGIDGETFGLVGRAGSGFCGFSLGEGALRTGGIDGETSGMIGWVGRGFCGFPLGEGAFRTGGMDGEISGFLGRVGSEFRGFPLGAGAFRTGAIEGRGPSGDLLSLGGIVPGSGGALVGASSVDFLPGDETGAGASGTTTGCSVCRCSLLGALGGRTGAGSFHTIGGGGDGRETICGGAELIAGGAELGGGNIMGALGCRDGVRTSLGGGTGGDISGGKTFAGGDVTFNSNAGAGALLVDAFP